MLVNFKEMMHEAKQKKYAVPQFNINNLEWTKYILEECQKLNIPVILGVSEGAVRYMGGYHIVVALVESLIKDLRITIPVCLHLDHGTFEGCFKAVDAGFSSVMIDASREELNKNIEITKKVVEYAHPKGVSVEAEIGHIGGVEDDISGKLFYARVDECKTLYNETNIDSIAPALGSVHGPYKGEPKLDFKTMREIDEALEIPLVLHGGSGIPDYQIKEAISCGIAKINVNTDLQIVWSKAVREFLNSDSKVYDPRKIIGSGENAIKTKIEELVYIFGTKSMK